MPSPRRQINAGRETTQGASCTTKSDRATVTHRSVTGVNIDKRFRDGGHLVPGREQHSTHSPHQVRTAQRGTGQRETHVGTAQEYAQLLRGRVSSPAAHSCTLKRAGLRQEAIVAGDQDEACSGMALAATCTWSLDTSVRAASSRPRATASSMIGRQLRTGLCTLAAGA